MKKKNLIIMTLVSTVVCFASAASMAADAANSTQGFYIGLHAGAAIIHSKGADSKTSWKDTTDHLNRHIFKNKTKAQFAGGASIGYDFYPQYEMPVRVELDYTARSMQKGNGGTTTAKSGNDKYKMSQLFKSRMDTLMLNAAYDFHNDSIFTPYITAGVGTAFVKYDSTMNINKNDNKASAVAANKSKTNFAWNAGVGVKANVTDNIAVDLSARYTYGGKVTANTQTGNVSAEKVSMNNTTKLNSTDVMLGVTYSF